MKTNEFISALRAAPQNQLVFTDMDGQAVPGGYHLTELKATSFDTVDCAGQVNRWQETIVQLWVPPDPADDYMTAAKFLKIFDQVRGMIPINFDTEIRVEYGDHWFLLCCENAIVLRGLSENKTRHVCAVKRISARCVRRCVNQAPVANQYE